MTSLDFDVSRETYEALEKYVSLIIKWNPKINLVAKSTIDEIWTRHIRDSAQIWPLAKKYLQSDTSQTWLDLGSGGGLPGLVMAILAKDDFPNLSFHLIESDQRKATFLRTVSRETKCRIEVHSKRIEDVDSIGAQVISARALASLADLLELSVPHIAPNATLFFPKGEKWQSEVEAAKESWSFSLQRNQSQTNPASAILEIGDLVHVKANV